MASSMLPEGDLAFNYFPGNYRWCHGLLIALSGAPWGGAEIDEINRIGLRLKEKAPDDDAAWFNEWSGEAARIEAIGHAEAAKGHALTAAFARSGRHAVRRCRCPLVQRPGARAARCSVRRRCAHGRR